MDIVYTYINHLDPKWRYDFERYAGAAKLLDRENDLRFTDGGELRFSLRSIESNLSGFDRVFIFTNSSLPDWLRKDHPKLRIVRHEDVIPGRFLPLFNSFAIESFLHRLPGVSRRFLYFNDDFIQLKRMHVQDFYRGQRAIFRCQSDSFAVNRLRMTTDPLTLEMQRGMRILRSIGKFPRTVFALSHSAYPVDVEVMQEVEEILEGAIENLRCSRFRGAHSFALINLVYPYYSIVKRRGALKMTTENFLRSAEECIQQVRPARFGSNLIKAQRKVVTKLRLRHAILNEALSQSDYACVNEGMSPQIEAQLKEWFPHSSTFEN